MGVWRLSVKAREWKTVINDDCYRLNHRKDGYGYYYSKKDMISISNKHDV